MKHSICLFSLLVLVGCGRDSGTTNEMEASTEPVAPPGYSSVQLELEKQRAIAIEGAENARMAEKLGLKVEEWTKLTLEEQRDLIRKKKESR